jgi:transcriptional regulator with XRE-family HTH domain
MDYTNYIRPDNITRVKEIYYMDINIGPRIAALRKSKSMTQEQLALALGVSPPAVSKWETGASCPDIALLCPLARALNTNVDTLLQFEETLTEVQIDERLNEIVETARNLGYEAADTMIQSLLHTYPSSIPLKSRAVTLFDLFAMLFPAQPQTVKDSWTKQKKQLLEEVRASGAPSCWQTAVSHLASIAILEGELDKAESLLKELPQQSTDSTSVWALLYLKKGEAGQALEVLQKRLYVLTRQIQNFLIQMMNPEMTPDTAKALELCVIYRRLEELLGVGNGMSPGFFAQAYQRAGQDQQALESMIQFVDAITGTVQKPNPVLFSPGVKIDGEHPASTIEIRRLLLKSLLEDAYYKQFLDNGDFRAAVDKLRKSIQEEEA